MFESDVKIEWVINIQQSEIKWGFKLFFFFLNNKCNVLYLRRINPIINMSWKINVEAPV